MNVSLDPQVQKFIEQKVRNGQYASPEEAVNQMLDHVRAQEELTPEDLDDLRAEIDIGIAEADRGEFAEFTAEDVIAERRAHRMANEKKP
jgi:antitoxin ParD1/3/4